MLYVSGGTPPLAVTIITAFALLQVASIVVKLIDALETASIVAELVTMHPFTSFT